MFKEVLRKLPLFSGMMEEDLERLCSLAKPVDVKAGHVLMEEGSPGDSLYVVLEGEFEVTKRREKQDVVLSVRKAGEVIGEMSLLDQSPRSASVRALEDGRVLLISQFAFQQVMACSPSAVVAILHTVTSRLRSTESLLVQNEKMAALGIMAAGLAHELNNPAAAAQRSATQLRDGLGEWQRLTDRIEAMGLSDPQREKISALRAEMLRCACAPVVLDPLARSDRESQLQDWLDEHGVEDGWEFAPVLVSFGWGESSLQDLEAHFGGDQLSVAVAWFTAGLSVYSLLEEVNTSAERISDLVKSVKTYSYLDQAPVQDVDLAEGLESTLVMLKHKLKQGVNVNRDYAPDLPRIEAYGSELNQVWTNLIDNAVDAMNGSGEITLKTYRDEENVVVEIADNGPGMPPEVRQHIFEPFYTTKGPGSGTGLGLHIVYNIVVDKHHGDIKVTSEPGETRFIVTLPIELARE